MNNNQIKNGWAICFQGFFVSRRVRETQKQARHFEKTVAFYNENWKSSRF